MTSYRVHWSAQTKRQLAGIWIAASDRNAVTRASHEIDKALARDPAGSGQKLAEGLWKIETTPLVVYYELDDANKLVQVIGCAYLP